MTEEYYTETYITEWKNKDSVIISLWHLNERCLGLYMARRLMGETGEVQKKRLLWLAQKIMIYDRE